METIAQQLATTSMSVKEAMALAAEVGGGRARLQTGAAAGEAAITNSLDGVATRPRCAITRMIAYTAGVPLHFLGHLTCDTYNMVIT